MRVLPLLLASILGSVGCAGDDGSDAADDDVLCDGAPAADWETFGAGFFTEQCQACHASDSPDRHGAPSDVVFDTEGDVTALAERVLARATGDNPTMPPEGGVSEDDRYLLEVWLRCE